MVSTDAEGLQLTPRNRLGVQKATCTDQWSHDSYAIQRI